MNAVDLSRLLVSRQHPIKDVVRLVDASGYGIALVTDPEGRLEATITDGDIRRAMLASLDLAAPVATLIGRAERAAPVTAPQGTSPEEMIRLMREQGVRHLPIVDSRGRVIDLVRLGDVDPHAGPPMTAVVMAGGFGTRLRPLTDTLPKPLLPVGDKPILERILTQLRDLGVRKVHVTTHFEADQIERHFGNGEGFGVDITYVPEHKPLGTAGGLASVDPTDGPLLVINGDVLTRLNFSDMLAFHREARADMSVGVRVYEIQVPYGVVDVRGIEVTQISEKPTVRFFINAGVYLVDSAVQRLVDRDGRLDMPELITRALAAGHKVVSFPIHEYWIDIGQPDEYERACDDALSGQF